MTENYEQKTTQNPDEPFSSIELLQKVTFAELDAWGERLLHRDEAFLNAAREYVERIKRNQDNVKAITEQFYKELQAWEKAAREELLVTTTPLQHFFPIKSYEEMNEIVENIQKKTASLLKTPLTAFAGDQVTDKFLETVEKYISFRINAREKYIDSLKKTSNVIFENQKIFFNMFAKQVQSAVFPFQKFMKNHEVKADV